MATGHGLPLSGARLGLTGRDDSGGKGACLRISTPAEFVVGSSRGRKIGYWGQLVFLMKMPRLSFGSRSHAMIRTSALPDRVTIDGAGLSHRQVALFDSSNTSQHHPHSPMQLSPSSLISTGLRVARCSCALKIAALSLTPVVVVSINDVCCIAGTGVWLWCQPLLVP